jgi:HAD superfamily hydrolase (TIGR01662 family)
MLASPDPSLSTSHHLSTAALFDADGTTIRSLDLWVQAYREGLEAQGIQADEDDVIDACMRSSAAQVIERFGITDLKALQEIIWSRVGTLYQQAELYPGVVEGLQELSAAGVKIGTVTNSRLELVRGVFERCGVADIFQDIVAREHVQCTKPHREPVDTGLGRLNCPPERSWMIGDSTIDIQAGRSAGTLTVAFHPPENKRYWSREELLVTKPDFIAETFKELVDIVLSTSKNERG